MSATLRKKQAARKKRFFQQGRRRIQKRLANTPGPERPIPMMTASNIHYEPAQRTRGLSAGGIGAIFLLAQKVGLIQEIDSRLHLLKRHLPYHESDHVLNIAFNILAGGLCIEHLELRRNDEVYLDALGAQRIPDPTTAGDFCRRFSEADVLTLMDAIHEARLRVWAQQPPEFFAEAILEADGSLVPSDAECKQGMDFAYDGQYGYHPLVISLANTAEPLYLDNRSGNRPSQERADEFLDKGVALVRRAGFRAILMRGDTRIAQTKHLDGWDAAGDIRFLFGYEASPSLQARADQLPAGSYRLLDRPPRYQIQTAPRQKPERVKPEIVRRRGYENLELIEEMVAEFQYRPLACRKRYRMIVLRKRIGVAKGQLRLFEEYRYFFYITNDGRGGRVLGQRSLRPGESDRPAQERSPRVDDPRGRPGEQLGVHGDGLVGVEPQGLEPRCWSPWRHVTVPNTSRSGARCCGWSSRPIARRSCGCRASSCGRAAG